MIAVRMRRLTLALLLAAAPVAISAQAATDIAIGQTLTGKAGGKTDLYRFVGGSGTTIKATLTAPGKAALILYTPAGEEMMTAQGTGSVTLKAILPLWDAFFIGVFRQGDGAKAYTLRLTGDEPDIHLALFARGVGFKSGEGKGQATTCWVEPGVKKRTIFSDLSGWYTDTTIGRQGNEYSQLFDNTDTLVSSKTNRSRVEGDDLIMQYDVGGSDPKQYKFPLAKELESGEPRKYGC